MSKLTNTKLDITLIAKIKLQSEVNGLKKIRDLLQKYLYDNDSKSIKVTIVDDIPINNNLICLPKLKFKNYFEDNQKINNNNYSFLRTDIKDLKKNDNDGIISYNEIKQVDSSDFSDEN